MTGELLLHGLPSLAVGTASVYVPVAAARVTWYPWGNCDPGGRSRAEAVYSAPTAGVFVASIERFRGDWAMWVVDETGHQLAYSDRVQTYGAEASEQVFVRLRQGQRVTLIGCNIDSPDVDVVAHYRLTPGDGYPSLAGTALDFVHLRPGGSADLREQIPVNIVLVGFEKRSVDQAALLRSLPKESRPIVRSRRGYGANEYLGISYTFDYNLVAVDPSYADSVFRSFARLGRKAPLTAYQRAYNNQKKNVLNVTSNMEINAVDAERWLALNPPSGVDTRMPTVYFLNWFDRPGFRFHVYGHMPEPDPDAGEDYSQMDYAKTVAWGGTPADDPTNGLGVERRVWFYDLSAGPDSWTTNYEVDTPDLSGDGKPDERFPVIWEYRKGGFRSPSKLTSDLGKVTRHVAINEMIAASPLYPATSTSDFVPRTIGVNLDTYNGTADDGAAERLVHPSVIEQALEDLMPDHRISTQSQAREFSTDPEFLACYSRFAGDQATLWDLENSIYLGYLGASGPSCYPTTPYVSWQSLFQYHATNFARLSAGGPNVEYEVSASSYLAPADAASPLYAYADDNQRDGTPSMTHQFLSANLTKYLGFTNTISHELGHHFGLAHPHDGYDYETDVESRPFDHGFEFLALGDESNTAMSYITNAWSSQYSQFDRDNRARWMAAAEIAATNRIAKHVLRSADAPAAVAALRKADDNIGKAKTAIEGHLYRMGELHARQAYEAAVWAAELAGVTIDGARTGLRLDDSGSPMNVAPHDGAFDRLQDMLGMDPETGIEIIDPRRRSGSRRRF